MFLEDAQAGNPTVKRQKMSPTPWRSDVLRHSRAGCQGHVFGGRARRESNREVPKNVPDTLASHILAASFGARYLTTLRCGAPRLAGLSGLSALPPSSDRV